jgi:hypothetical protein
VRLRADKQARLVRREEAVARNTAWQALSTEAKIASLRERRGESKKQIEKLLRKAN